LSFVDSVDTIDTVDAVDTLETVDSVDILVAVDTINKTFYFFLMNRNYAST
jgi:hypothetical protein